MGGAHRGRATGSSVRWRRGVSVHWRRGVAAVRGRRGVAVACAALAGVVLAVAGIGTSMGFAPWGPGARSGLAVSASPGSAASGSTVPAGASAAVAGTAAVKDIRGYNPGEAHSPRLLRDLSGPLDRTGMRRQTALEPATTTSSSLPQGVDVASFQHPGGAAISWSLVAKAGYKFAAIKATEAWKSTKTPYYKNPYYPADSSGATAAGLYVTAYAFAVPNISDGTSQADYLAAYTGYKIGGLFLPVMLDLEYDPYISSDHTNMCYGLNPSQMVTWISQFVKEAKTKTGQPPIIYTTADWWDTCTGNSKAFSADPLWVAAYASNTPPLPAGWNDWTFWQYTSSGTVSGITGAVDQDYFTAGPGTQQTLAGSAVSVQVPSLNALAGQAMTYSATGLPAGLSITPGGLISGTASVPGAYAVTVTPSASSAVIPASESFTWNVHGTITVRSPGSQSTVAGSPAGLQVQATDSAAGYKPAFTATGLPPGLSMSPAGRISGWPYQTGTYQVKVSAADSLQASGSASFTWTVTRAADQGAAGPFRLDNGGKCLDTANGTRMQIWRCTGGTNQKWTVVQDGTLRVSGKCLDVYHAGTADRTPVDLSSCNGSGAQRWQFGTDGELVNPASGKCLDDPYFHNANGTKLDIYRCTGGTNQRWTGPASPFPSGIGGKCLDDARHNTANGTRLDIYTCDGGATQHWTVMPNGTIRVSGKCMEVYNSGTASRTPVDISTCNGSAGQTWRMAPKGPIGSELINPHSGLCLADPGDSATNGTRLVAESCPASPDPGTSWHVM
jgi:GH25 family lysozyme M1 (1,4-beta-N-acetylmuramidase)